MEESSKSIKYLNKSFSNNRLYEGPKYLYKYRSFDKYTFDMLENNYLYLCPAGKLDDPTECNVDFNLDKYVDLKTGKPKNELISIVADQVRPYISENNFKKVELVCEKQKVNNESIKDFTMDLFNETIMNMMPSDFKQQFSNVCNLLYIELNKLQEENNLNEFLSILYYAKSKVGVCSLSDSYCIDELWKNYTKNNGYCIEYDVSNYCYNNLIFPVVYTDNRNIDFISTFISFIMGTMIKALSKNDNQCDNTQIVQLLLSKNTIREYQREWRIIGNPSERIVAPKITRIIVEPKAENDDIEKMKSFCKKNNILLEFRK